ncbi:hypothetical protein [Propionivibrio sp.]|uniref:hypothetical protein n=1 Tax=Propionivibrio sp. TaxID=2212460 RepID=UPI003BF12F75
MATVKKAGTPVQSKSSTSNLPPAAPELVARKRKRLAKAFSRPLDKKLKKPELVREKLSMTEGESAQLAELKQRLVVQGIAIKKSELLRAGLMLIATLDDDALKDLLAKVTATG